jgi:1-acyl-sn-glycerol-3-phosphate acyltransferase
VIQLADIPILGSAVPRRGNRLSTGLCRWLLRRWGWRFEGNLPDVSKAVMIVVPHTSNWDFILGVLAMFAIGLRVSFLAKHTLFWWPFGVIMRWLGGIAVDRRSSTGVVDQIVATFAARDELMQVVAREGKGGRVERWKTGFYHIAHGARVPIAPVSFDYGRRVIRFGEAVWPTGDIDCDLAVFQEFFAVSSGKRDV